MKRLIVAMAAIMVAACASTSFTKTGIDPSPVGADVSCPAAVIQSAPADRRYVELGFCTTSIPGGGIITDNTPKAIAELQSCACQNGGNAMIFHGEGETGVHTGLGYSQQRVKARATVLYVYPKQ